MASGLGLMGRHTLSSAQGCVLTPRSLEINPKQTNKKGRIPFPGFVLQEMSNSALLQAGRREFREKKIPESIDPLKNACAGKRSPEDEACWKDRRMFITQPCLLHDNYHAACVLTFLMTVIVPTAQVGKKMSKTQQNNTGADKAHVCRRASSVFCTHRWLEDCDEIQRSMLHTLLRRDKLRLDMELWAVHVFQMGNLCPPASPNSELRGRQPET